MSPNPRQGLQSLRRTGNKDTAKVELTGYQGKGERGAQMAANFVLEHRRAMVPSPAIIMDSSAFFLPDREPPRSVEGVGLLIPTVPVAHCPLLDRSRALDVYPGFSRGRGREWTEESNDASKVQIRILGAAQPRQQTQLVG